MLVCNSLISCTRSSHQCGPNHAPASAQAIFQVGGRQEHPRSTCTIRSHQPLLHRASKGAALVVELLVIYARGARTAPIALPRRAARPAASAPRGGGSPATIGPLCSELAARIRRAGAMRDRDYARPAFFAAEAPPSVRRCHGFHELFDPSGDLVPIVAPRQDGLPELCGYVYDKDQADLVVLSLWPVLDLCCEPDYFAVVGGAAAA